MKASESPTEHQDDVKLLMRTSFGRWKNMTRYIHVARMGSVLECSLSVQGANAMSDPYNKSWYFSTSDTVAASLDQ